MTGYPTRPDQMAARWLSETLGQPADALRGFTASAIGTGQMCDSFRLTLDWVEGVGDGRLPSVVAKCPSADDASRAIAAQLGSYLLEVRWYQKLADDVSVARPPCYFAEIADNHVDFLLLLGDLSPARQGDQLAGATLAQLHSVAEQAAALHAPLWGSARLDSLDWINRDLRPMIKSMFPVLYAGFRERYADRLAPEVLDLGADVVTHIDGYLDRTPHVRTLTHGDMRIDNILFAPEGTQCWLVDWQTLGTGSGASDLAYLAGTSIADPAKRAAADRPLFDHWITALTERGVDANADQLWGDYRIGALSGYFMAVFASMSVERTERGDEMFAVMAERPARQALDLDSLSLL